MQSAPSEIPSSSGDSTTGSFNDSPRATRGQVALVIAAARQAKRDVTYCTVDGVELKMDVFLPKSATSVNPLVVFIHGGGWSKGDKTAQAGMTDFPALLNAGFTVATLDYRLAPQYKFPAMIQDVKCAIRSLRAHANDYKIDPNRIGVWGDSAGGHLVNLLGTTDASAGFDVGEYLDQSSHVKAVVDMFGPSEIPLSTRAYLAVGNQVFDESDFAKASPINYVTSDDPPFLILHGDVDKVVPLAQSQDFYNKLTAAGVPAQLVVVHNGPHGLLAPDESPSRDALTTMIVNFFVNNIK